MAQIFKRTIVKQKISELKVKDFDKKLAIIQLWYKAYQDGSLQKKTEGQCEQSFNDDIFKKVLGYTEYPSQPHTIVPQLSPERGGQRADAGLGYFDTNRQRIFAVVEIKDVNKPLDRSQQREGNLTPIQQAFKYKPLFKDCRFVIATNFYEIRLFQDNQLDYELFTLKSLCDPANDYFELKKFILLLSAENFVSGRGKSKTEELLAEIRIEQEKISKDFYNQYSDLRLELMRDIWKQNHFKKNTKDIHIVTDKAQKLLDRIVFVSFCEDTGLLPDNTLHKVFKHSESSFSSVWDTLKGFFSAVDSGSDKLGIPEGYNGGLFHEDSELDNLKISDDALKSLGKIGNYDFENELTVNILGHVFEQSISDLEEIKQKVDPDEASKKSKRKKDGIFYTPEYIVDYIVQNSLGKYLRENEERIFEKYELSKAKTEKTYREREQKALQEYQDFLHTVKVVDPACGSGAFLVKVFDYLLEENRRVGELIGGLFSQDQVYKDILKNNIYGVDLNEESVRITQLSLWLKTAQKGKKLTYLDKNIRVGNSLIADPKVAGSKAFNWQVEFKEVFEKGGFDVVVGNPPYVNIFNINSTTERNFYKNNFITYKNKSDLYSFFTERSYEIIKNNGILGFIFSNSWLGTDSFEEFRKFLLEKTSISQLVDLPKNVFKDAMVQTTILIFTKQSVKDNKFSLFELEKENTFNFIGERTYHEVLQNPNHTFSFKEIPNLKLVLTVNLGEIAKFSLGIKTGNNEKFISEIKFQTKNYPLIKGRDIERFHTPKAKLNIYYDPEEMKKRKGAGPRRLEYFLKTKILIQDIAKEIIASVDRNNNLCDDTITLIYSLENNYYFEALCCFLNSKIVNNWFKATYSKGLHIKKSQLENIPIPIIDENTNLELKSHYELLEKKLIEYKETVHLAHDFIKDKYRIDVNLEKINKDEINSLISKKISTSINQQEELYNWIINKLEIIQELSDQIDIKKQTIETMVMNSYGLTNK